MTSLDINLNNFLYTFFLYFHGVLFFSFSLGVVMFYMHPTVYPVGKTNLSFECRSRVIIFRVWEHRNASLKLQLRNHSNDNWTSVFELNGANEFKENKSASFDGYTVLSLNQTNGTHAYSNKQITLEGSVEPKQCTVDPQKSPDVRCVLSYRSQIIDSTEKRIFSIEGGYCFGLNFVLYFIEHNQNEHVIFLITNY